jgi:hypothetical protein
MRPEHIEAGLSDFWPVLIPVALIAAYLWGKNDGSNKDNML